MKCQYQTWTQKQQQEQQMEHLNRDRIAVKQKIDLSFAPLLWEDMSRILKATEDIFFEVYYPNPESGEYETKTV